MAIHVDLRQFAEGLTQAAIGSMAGKLAGQQMADQQQQQEFNQALNLAQLGANQQDQQNRLLTSQLPNLTPESQARALTNMAGQPSPYAGMLNTPYVAKHPELAQFFRGQQPAPAGAPAGWMGAAAGQQIPQPPAVVGGPGQPNFAVGGQNYALKGVDPKEATRLVTGMDKALGEMRGIKLTDPRAIQARDEYFRQRTALGRLDTPEKMTAANQLYQNILNFQSSVGGPAVQAADRATLEHDQTYHRQQVNDAITNLDDAALAGALPDLLKQEDSLDQRRGGRGGTATGIGSHKRDISEIEFLQSEGLDQDAAKLAGEVRRSWKAKMTPQQTLAAQKSAMQFLGQYSPRQITPDLVRQAFKDAPGLIEGMTDAELRGFGSKGLEGEWQKDLGILSNPKRWAQLPPEARKALLAEISGTAALTGRKIKIPADIVLKMTPEEQRRLAQRDQQLEMDGTRLQQGWARILLDQRKFENLQHQQKAGVGAKGSILTQNSKAKQLHDQWTEAKDDFNRAMKGAEMTLADFDPEKPNPASKSQMRLGQLYQETQQRSKALKAFLMKQGLDVDSGADTPLPTDVSGKGKALKDLTPEELAARFAAAAAAKLKGK